MLIPDDLLSDLERTINASIHELVFALHHLEDGDDQIEEAQNCLTTVGMNVDRLQEQIHGCVVLTTEHGTATLKNPLPHIPDGLRTIGTTRRKRASEISNPKS